MGVLRKLFASLNHPPEPALADGAMLRPVDSEIARAASAKVMFEKSTLDTIFS